MRVLPLTNRLEHETLEVTWDGRRTLLQPGVNYVTEDVAYAAVRQHPIMGTEDPENPGNYEALVGCAEWTTFNDCTPVTRPDPRKAPQRIDRTRMIDPNANNFRIAHRPTIIGHSGHDSPNIEVTLEAG